MYVVLTEMDHTKKKQSQIYTYVGFMDDELNKCL